jgi:hypothetical protein
MAKQVLTTLDFASVGRIQNLPDGTQPQDAATVAQLRAAVEGLAQKDDVRVRTASNISLASPGATLDGVTMVLNDRVLVAGQTAQAENGIYIWSGAAVPMTRSADANTGTELLSALVPVTEGTSAGTVWRQTAVNITLGTTAILFIAFGTVAAQASETSAGISEIATQSEVDAGLDDQRTLTPAKLANWSGRTRRLSQTIGDGTATQFTVTHNFNTRDIDVVVRRNSGNFDQVLVDVDYTGVNTVRITFNAAPAAGAFQVFLQA